MAMRYSIEGLRDTGDPRDQVAATMLEAFLKQRGKDIPLPAEATQKVYPEISLREEFRRQAQIIFERVGKPLGMSEKDCLEQLPPNFPERLPSYDKLHLTVPLLVPKFEGLSWLKVVEAAKLGISDYLKNRIAELNEWPDPRGIVIPSKPYGIWVQDGTRYVDRKPMDVRSKLESGERGGTHWDGVSLAIICSDMVKNMYWDLVGSEVGSDRLPSLVWWVDRPRFHYSWVDGAGPLCRALVCGSQTKA